jgi:hypothetical protein
LYSKLTENDLEDVYINMNCMNKMLLPSPKFESYQEVEKVYFKFRNAVIKKSAVFKTT